MVPGETSVLPSRLAADVAGGARATELEKLGSTCREEHALSEMCQKTWLGFGCLG